MSPSGTISKTLNPLDSITFPDTPGGKNATFCPSRIFESPKFALSMVNLSSLNKCLYFLARAIVSFVIFDSLVLSIVFWALSIGLSSELNLVGFSKYRKRDERIYDYSLQLQIQLVLIKMEYFDNIFPKNTRSELDMNQFIKRRILNNCEQNGSCLIWNKSTALFSIYKKQKHIRQWIYDYCVGEKKEGYNVNQKCKSKKVCINHRHLILVKNGMKRSTDLVVKKKKKKKKILIDSDIESVNSDIVSDNENKIMEENTCDEHKNKAEILI